MNSTRLSLKALSRLLFQEGRLLLLHCKVAKQLIFQSLVIKDTEEELKLKECMVSLTKTAPFRARFSSK